MAIMIRSIVSQALVCILLHVAEEVEGHGRLIDPPSRSSMWRAEYGGYPTPHNTQDVQLNCGGGWHLWGVMSGRCGICGDPYDGTRENEAGGKYATGIITRHYREGQTINVTIDLTTNHGGWHEFRICPNNDIHRAVTEACLDRHLLADENGVTRHVIPKSIMSEVHTLKLVLPRGLTCTQCVLQWKWNTAVNWGCENGICGKGLGNQDQWYGCSDVSVSRAGIISGSHGSQTQTTTRGYQGFIFT